MDRETLLRQLYEVNRKIEPYLATTPLNPAAKLTSINDTDLRRLYEDKDKILRQLKEAEKKASPISRDGA